MSEPAFAATVDNLLSGFIGALVGGVATLIGAHYSYKKQRELEIIHRREEEELRKQNAVVKMQARVRSMVLTDNPSFIQQDLLWLRTAMLEEFDLMCANSQKNQDFVEALGLTLREHGMNMGKLNPLKERAIAIEWPKLPGSKQGGWT